MEMAGIKCWLGLINRTVKRFIEGFLVGLTGEFILIFQFEKVKFNFWMIRNLFF
jgi:hypothetical protein